MRSILNLGFACQAKIPAPRDSQRNEGEKTGNMDSMEQLLAKEQVPAVTSVDTENISLCSSRWGERKDENSPDHCYLKKGPQNFSAKSDI